MKVLVSGCFDLLHSGHVAFLEEAAAIGELHVALGSDRTVLGLKGRPPVNSEAERLYMISSLRCVHRAYVSRGSGLMDFVPELEAIRPDVFFVNADGDSEAKRNLIAQFGIEYRVSARRPHGNLVARSTTALRQAETVPYRLDLAGGWLDQPSVSKLAAGPVIGCSLEPSEEYELRSGMASSTRRAAIALWGPRLPVMERERLAKMIFAFENPPGTTNVAGSQDTIGIVYPGVTRMDYDGQYWPHKISSTLDRDVIDFLQSHLYLKFTNPRPGQFEVLAKTNINAADAQRLADAANVAWDALLARDATRFGRAMTASFQAQIAMFPLMTTPEICEIIEAHSPNMLGHKITGAGGGGYVVFFSEKPIEGATRLTIRTEEL